MRQSPAPTSSQGTGQRVTVGMLRPSAAVTSGCQGSSFQPRDGSKSHSGSAEALCSDRQKLPGYWLPANGQVKELRLLSLACGSSCRPRAGLRVVFWLGVRAGQCAGRTLARASGALDCTSIGHRCRRPTATSIVGPLVSPFFLAAPSAAATGRPGKRLAATGGRHSGLLMLSLSSRAKRQRTR